MSINVARKCAGLKELLTAHYADAGGEDILSEGQRPLIRCAAMLELQLEMLETKFCQKRCCCASGNVRGALCPPSAGIKISVFVLTITRCV
jgi:hypothetical protein